MNPPSERSSEQDFYRPSHGQFPSTMPYGNIPSHHGHGHHQFNGHATMPYPPPPPMNVYMHNEGGLNPKPFINGPAMLPLPYTHSKSPMGMGPSFLGSPPKDASSVRDLSPPGMHKNPPLVTGPPIPTPPHKEDLVIPDPLPPGMHTNASVGMFTNPPFGLHTTNPPYGTHTTGMHNMKLPLVVTPPIPAAHHKEDLVIQEPSPLRMQMHQVSCSLNGQKGAHVHVSAEGLPQVNQEYPHQDSMT